MTNNRTVYIPHKGPHDYSKADDWGIVRPILNGYISKVRTSDLAYQIKAGLATSVANDLILISSLPIASNIASAIMAFKHGRVNYLIHIQDKYVERTLSLKSLMGAT